MSQSESNLAYFLQDTHLENAYILRDILTGLEQDVWATFKIQLRNTMKHAGHALNGWAYAEYDAKDNSEFEPYFSSSIRPSCDQETCVGVYLRSYFNDPTRGRTGVFFIVQNEAWKTQACQSAEAQAIRKQVLDIHPDIDQISDDYTAAGYTLCHSNSDFIFDHNSAFFRQMAKDQGRDFAKTITEKVVGIIHTLEGA